jgi:DNA replication and repair protein RecF
MWVARLNASDWRNYEELSAEFGRGAVVLLGANAQGKTNLLEGLGFLATGLSHRESSARALVRIGAVEATLRATVQQAPGLVEPEAHVSAQTGRTLSLGGLPCERLEDYLGALNAIVFHAEDVALASGPAAGRRRYLNEEIAKRRPAYLTALTGYRRCLAQRNAALKRPWGGRRVSPVVDAFTEELAQFGERLLTDRIRHVEMLAPRAVEIHARLAGGTERLRVGYEATAEPGCIREVLASLGEREAERGMTLAGPHRDDLALEINGRGVRRTASRGQQKTCALALKLAGAYLDGSDPAVPLLDDVMSELDAGRRERLAEELQAFDQCFVAATRVSDVAEGLMRRADVRTVVAGKVSHA